MISITQTKLRRERSEGNSGVILNEQSIPHLKEGHYYVQPIDLDGDAPKQFVSAYFFTPNSTIRKSRPHTWERFIAKSAEKWYPHESVLEFLINRIGQTLGLRMNEVKLLRVNGQIRFFSKYFLEANETLIHGAEICGAHLEDLPLAEEIANDPKSARDLFTFEFIKEAIENTFQANSDKILLDLVKMLGF
ncbi:MAG: hypothetical protein R2787_00500 [Saprospiraceae bacterium]